MNVPPPSLSRHARFPWGVAAAASVVFVILIGLGTWQVQRLHWKEALLSDIAERTAAWLRLLAAQAGAVINGHRLQSTDGSPQSLVDRVIG